MDARMKYVVVNNGGLAGDQLVIFPSFVSHKDFREMGKIVSAGFVGWTNEKGFYAHGKSDTLGLASREEDNILLRLMFKDAYEDMSYAGFKIGH